MWIRRFQRQFAVALSLVGGALVGWTLFLLGMMDWGAVVAQALPSVDNRVWWSGPMPWVVASEAVALLAIYVVFLRLIRQPQPTHPQNVLPTAGRRLDRAACRESLLAMAVHHAADPIIITDLDGMPIDANPAFERMIGMDCDKALQERLRVLPARDDPHPPAPDLWATLDRGFDWSGHLNIHPTDHAEPIETEATVSPVFDNEGRCLQYIVTERDITETVAMKAKLSHTQKMEAIGRLAGGVAHDFNNLLTVITGYCDLVLERLSDDAQHRTEIVEIKRAGDRAAQLTHQLLAFSRQQQLTPAHINLNEIVRDMETMLRRLLPEDIALTTELDPDLWWIYADRSQIEQVLLNLTVNARDAMASSNGGELVVSTHNVEMNEEMSRRHRGLEVGLYAALSVNDSGCGMDEETRNRIFEPFFTTKDTDKGTGIGLATVYGIVKQSGGDIMVQSEPGCGSTFEVCLPRVQVAANTVEVCDDEEPTSCSIMHWRILLAEDDRLVRSLMCSILGKAGHFVTEAPDGVEALARLEDDEEGYDLIVTDVIMPTMSGFDLVKQARQRIPDIHAVFVSGYRGDADGWGIEMDERMAFVQKPFTPTTLLAAVQELMLQLPRIDESSEPDEATEMVDSII